MVLFRKSIPICVAVLGVSEATIRLLTARVLTYPIDYVLTKPQIDEQKGEEGKH